MKEHKQQQNPQQQWQEPQSPSNSAASRDIAQFENEFKQWQARKNIQEYPQKDEKVHYNQLQDSENPITTTNGQIFNDISEGYENQAIPKSVTGPLNTTLGVNAYQTANQHSKQFNDENSNHKGERFADASKEFYNFSNNTQKNQQYLPLLHPQRQPVEIRDPREKLFGLKSSEGIQRRMSAAGRSNQFADGRQSRSGSRSQLDQSEVSAISVVSGKIKAEQAETSQRRMVNYSAQQPAQPANPSPKRMARVQDQREVSLDRKRARMAEDAARAQEAQNALDENARKRRMKQQEQLLDDIRNSNLALLPKKNQMHSNQDSNSRIISKNHQNQKSEKVVSDYGDVNLGDDEIDEGTQRYADGRYNRSIPVSQYQKQHVRMSSSHLNDESDTVKAISNLYKDNSYKGIQNQTQNQFAASKRANQFETQRVTAHDINISDPDINSAGSKTFSIQPRVQSRSKMMDQLFHRVMQLQNPKEAFYQYIANDKANYEFCKENIIQMVARIDSELQKGVTNRLNAKLGNNEMIAPVQISATKVDRVLNRESGSGARGSGAGLGRLRSKALQEVLQRSGSRSKFFSSKNSDGRNSRGQMDPGSNSRAENSQQQHLLDQENKNLDASTLSSLHKEFSQAVKLATDDQGSIILVDVLINLHMLSPETL